MNILTKKKVNTLELNLVRSSNRSIAGSPSFNSLYAFPTPCNHNTGISNLYKNFNLNVQMKCLQVSNHYVLKYPDGKRLYEFYDIIHHNFIIIVQSENRMKGIVGATGKK